MPIRYLNTDLDLVAPRDITELAALLEAHGVRALQVTHAEDSCWYAVFETEEQHEEPERNMSAMLDAIESFDANARALWSQCTLREFNIGYDCGDERWAFNNGLTNTTLQRAAAVGASLRVTLYPERPANNGTINENS
ncbi:MAG: hypothetical protein HY288_01500 [Planctomycetia bacterium]|nr:hypothetical protein [Planctomycetia bacterium]